MRKIPLHKMFLAGLLVGTLDITAASIEFYSRTGKGPEPVFRYIARAVFGNDAATPGWVMPAAGLLFHYVIAMGFTVLFFACYRAFPLLAKQPVITSLLYGVFMHFFMFSIVLPLSKVPAPVFHLNRALIAIAILIVCISIPLVLLARKWTATKKQDQHPE